MNNNRLYVTWEVSLHCDGDLLRTFLRKEKSMSRKTLAEVKHGGGALLVNGVEKGVRERLRSGDIVTVLFPPEKVSEALTPLPMELDVIAEDDHMLVVNKPAGLPTVPSSNDPGRSLAHGVIHYYLERNIPYTFHAVTRLDRDTSGLMIIAKHRYAHDQFMKAGIKREYVALVEGHLEETEGTIDASIGRRDGSIIEREVREDGQRGVTHYTVMKLLDDATLVRVRLETGRTHQIRVHFSYIGHSLLGDTLYGGSDDFIPRQALHSAALMFVHPFTGEKHEYEAVMPEDLTDAWNKRRLSP
ncbi:RluA family pseudouridine synthase [Bacillus sp. H-16]|uniref:RluA family pseudouridine synthase n=1 Tax=Alteribacter salitolerans TaxID=2912333 RepID=UPI00196263F9|nr:RluA family pseudouridine synthase [Alteribacter salitolerans]MBM7096072.1 RluA family pseudouridine synthase [Alteribacter salitolerans]